MNDTNVKLLMVTILYWEDKKVNVTPPVTHTHTNTRIWKPLFVVLRSVDSFRLCCLSLSSGPIRIGNLPAFQWEVRWSYLSTGFDSWQEVCFYMCSFMQCPCLCLYEYEWVGEHAAPECESVQRIIGHTQGGWVSFLIWGACLCACYGALYTVVVFITNNDALVYCLYYVFGEQIKSETMNDCPRYL